MQDIQVICADLLAVLNTTVICVYGKDKQSLETATTTVRNATLSDTDPSGAVKFTVAVVLLYGVGVIGLLGITARRNRRVQMMDKEVNKFIKMQNQAFSFRRKTKSRKGKMKAVGKLIAALHFQEKGNDESDIVSPTPTNYSHKGNSSTWTAGMGLLAHAPQSAISKTTSLTLFNETSTSIPSTDITITSDRSGYFSSPVSPRFVDDSSKINAPLLHQNSLEIIKEQTTDVYIQ